MSPQTSSGAPPQDLIPGGEAAPECVNFKAIVAAREPFSGIQHHNIHKHDRVITVKVSGIPIFGPDGKFRGMRGISRDITQRIQAEQQRRESEERFRKLFEDSHLATVLQELPAAELASWLAEREQHTALHGGLS